MFDATIAEFHFSLATSILAFYLINQQKRRFLDITDTALQVLSHYQTVARLPSHQSPWFAQI